MDDGWLADHDVPAPNLSRSTKETFRPRLAAWHPHPLSTNQTIRLEFLQHL
jgi:hypothetical protein